MQEALRGLGHCWSADEARVARLSQIKEHRVETRLFASVAAYVVFWSSQKNPIEKLQQTKLKNHVLAQNKVQGDISLL